MTPPKAKDGRETLQERLRDPDSSEDSYDLGCEAATRIDHLLAEIEALRAEYLAAREAAGNGKPYRRQEVKKRGRTPPRPEMLKAQTLVRHAVAAGTLVKPLDCSECGVHDPRGKDGRSIIHAHHYNGYDKPFDIQWLCAHCHRKVTPGAHGERNATSKLALADVLYIRSSRLTTPDLAKELGVSANTVDSARNGRTWQHVAFQRIR